MKKKTQKRVKRIFKRLSEIKWLLLIFLAIQVIFGFLLFYSQYSWREREVTDTYKVQGKIESYWIFNDNRGHSDKIYITIAGKEYELVWHGAKNIEGYQSYRMFNFDELIGTEITLFVFNGTNTAVAMYSNTTTYYRLEYYNSYAETQRTVAIISIPIIWVLTTIIFGFICIIFFI